ncbi:hypothetical protein ACFFJT_21010 [Dyella flava]|uniref:Membrane protein involved in the export of O-antigen and teichoic acid n=1 Tax=Dyella flava TaxID=1920170 RepID=A0ABS2JXV7_9GAMM|nr:hypothetical protein [Dyella flava]MBM7123832.1 hypothetical protein [Dyella flava]GLQ52674.1 hypothetical protein GCM10010872_41230 [Dyella flava]
MNTAWQLWLQLFRRVPVLVVLGNVLRLAALYFAVQWLRGEPRLAPLTAWLFGMASWVWHIGQGFNLRSICIPESFLLPQFRRRLLEYGAIDIAIWVLLPLLFVFILKLPYTLLIASILPLVPAFGLLMGSNPRASVFIWPVFIVLGWAPRFFVELTDDALHSPLTPLLILALTALLLRFSLAPLLRIEDREADTSPLESTGLNRGSTRHAPGEPQRLGRLGKRLNALYDWTSQRAMNRALAGYSRRPDLAHRMLLVRRLLLPHDNPEAIALRIILVAVIVSFYFLAMLHRQRVEPAVIGAYTIMLSLSRFPQLNIGMALMRPNMADLYLTLAPETRAEYQKTISDALLILVPISMLTALTYTALGAVLVHAADPWHMLFVALIVSAAASLAALSLHLIGPESRTGRSIANLVILFGVMAVYWGGYWLVGATGYLIGGGVLAVVTLGFALTVWFAAQREYQQRAPRFDAPIG